MNEVMQAICQRRSIRAFTDRQIPEDILMELADAALHAPSGMGKKTWKFFVVTNPGMIKKLCDAVGKELGRDGYNMYSPAALIIPTNERDSRFGKEDNACALQNIFLAAESHGVGSVWINQLQGICDTDNVRPVLKEMGVPDEHVVYGLAALGYADPSAQVRPFNPVGEVTRIK